MDYEVATASHTAYEEVFAVLSGSEKNHGMPLIDPSHQAEVPTFQFPAFFKNVAKHERIFSTFDFRKFRLAFF